MITIKHQSKNSSLEIIAYGIEFTFESKVAFESNVDAVHKILESETDPVKFLCSSFLVRDLASVDNILSVNLEKRLPEGIELLQNSASVLLNQEGSRKSK